MALLYFDGFDAHIQPRFSGLDVGAGSMQDAGYYWRGGTPQKFGFPEGFESIGAFGKIPGVVGGQYWANSSIGSRNAVRVGFWAKGNAATSAFDLVRLGYFGAGSDYPYCRNLRVNANGTISINGDGATHWTSPFSLWGFSEWRHFEFFANKAGRVELRVDGALFLDLQTPAIEDRFPMYVALGGLATGNSGHMYDHLYVTDGPRLQSSGIHGVQVVAGVDAYKGLHSGLQGTLIIGDNRYLTNPRNARITSQLAYAKGENLSNILNFLFPLNPSTAEPWDASGLSSVSQWGLCFYHNSFLPKGEIRVTQAHLAVLRDFDERGPIVEARPAPAVTSFAGPWRKTDPEMTFSAHIRPIPRRDILKEADTPSLFIGDNGCILFSAESGGDPPITSVGLTFAEEFREDYKDWVRVDGVGKSFESWFISGYSILGEGNRKFQDNYVTVNYENVPTGKAYIQGLWDYSESPDTGRWSQRQVIDNKGGDYTHAHRRIKLRGHGKALSIKITNHGDYPFIINGWTVLASSNSTV